MKIIERLKELFGVRQGYLSIDEARTRLAIKRLFGDEA